METFQKLLSLADSKEVTEGADLPKVQLHKWLTLGQTEWVCRYGTLSDGHEKITPAQRYAQAIKEMYYIAHAIKMEKAIAKRAQAKLLRAKARLGAVENEPDRLEVEADIEEAQSQLAGALINVEDRMRMLRTYDQVRRELGPSVEAQYPMGLEQAEKDNWEAVYRYRMEAEKVPGMSRQLTFNVPLPPEMKAKLGIEYGRMDSLAPLLIADKTAALAMLPDRSIETKQLENK